LTAADRRVLTQAEPVLDDATRAALLDTVLHQARRPDCDAVQFAVVRMSSEDALAMVIFASDHVAVTSGRPSIDPSSNAIASYSGKTG
jgi:hypothetical protein